MPPELIVATDLADAALTVFMDVRPRTVALSGGTTPRPFYEALARAAYPWEDVTFVLADERCVAANHPDSNLGMASRALLSRVPARVVAPSGEACDADRYERDLRAALGARTPALDLAILGLGDDGHTASLFPGDGALDERDRWVARVERPDHPRLTVTLPVLDGAGVALFLVAGERKRRAVAAMLAGEAIPAARVAASRVVIVADRDAAGEA